MMLGELIAALEAADPATIVPVGFANPHQYRGDYSAIGFVVTKRVRVASMLEAARDALTITGGYYQKDMTVDTFTDVYLAYTYGSTGEELGHVLLSYMLGKPQRPIPLHTRFRWEHRHDPPEQVGYRGAYTLRRGRYEP